MSFKLFPFANLAGYSSVAHATIGKDSGRHGDRIPGIWLFQNTRLYICFSTNANANNCFLAKTTLPLLKNSTIVVQQIQSPDNYQYYFQVDVDGKRIHNTLNEKPLVFNDVTYYASDPWYNPAKAILTDFDLVTYKHKGNYYKKNFKGNLLKNNYIYILYLFL